MFKIRFRLKTKINKVTQVEQFNIVVFYALVVQFLRWCDVKVIFSKT